MPELPEVEIIVRGLKRTILKKTIDSIYINSPKIENDNPSGWLNILPGKEFRAIRRRGKNILVDLSDNYTLWVHLKMTGHLYFLPDSTEIEKHDLMIFRIRDNSHSLRFNDYRRFGRIRLFRTDEVLMQEGLADLGPDPLEISPDEFVGLFRGRQRMIKPALLDQTLISGLGNIYSDEALFLAKIHPRKLNTRISRTKLTELHKNIQKILKKSIRAMGTTVDTYSGVDGRPGGFKKYLQVYGREGERCYRCGSIIKREKVGSRSAHFCPRCQRKP
jgi:formamidopyrimidine-DNA glycosylase